MLLVACLAKSLMLNYDEVIFMGFFWQTNQLTGQIYEFALLKVWDSSGQGQKSMEVNSWFAFFSMRGFDALTVYQLTTLIEAELRISLTECIVKTHKRPTL